MTEPTNLNKFKKQKTKQVARGNTLCKRGFHKWAFEDKKQFDVQSGKLVSVQTCQRCGRQRNHIQ